MEKEPRLSRDRVPAVLGNVPLEATYPSPVERSSGLCYNDKETGGRVIWGVLGEKVARQVPFLPQSL